MGALAVSALIWEIVGSEIVTNLASLSIPQRVIGFTYPVLDLALLVSAMVLVARRGRHQFDPRLMTLSVAFASQVAADLGFLSIIEDDDIEDHDRAEMTAIAVSQANYMGRMVTDIVMLARDTPHLLTRQATGRRGGLHRVERRQNQMNAAMPGTGLGLAILTMIAKAHNGSAIYRTSERLGGACFSVHLPNSTVSDSESPIRRIADPQARPSSRVFLGSSSRWILAR